MLSQFLRLFIFLIIMAPLPSLALSKLGHQAVCQLAYDNTSIQIQNKIDNLLQSLPAKHLALINDYNYQKKHSPITFAKACTWPDAIKRIDKFKQFNSWHYLNIARTANSQSTFDCNKNCITQAIRFHIKQMETSTDHWQKLQALMFLGHWLGDIHQPLHISFSDDRGGNNTTIISKTKCKNLHWYWDECLITTETSDLTTLVKKLQNKWGLMLKATSTTILPRHWAKETHKITRQAELLYCQKTNGACMAIKPQEATTLPDNYRQHFYPVIQDQLLKSAIRLNTILNNTL